MQLQKQTCGVGVLCTLTLSAGVLQAPVQAQSSSGLVRLMVPAEDTGNQHSRSQPMIVTSRAAATDTGAITTTTIPAAQPRAQSEPVAARADEAKATESPAATVEPLAMQTAHPTRTTTGARILPLDYEMAAPSSIRNKAKITAVALDAPTVQTIQLTPNTTLANPAPVPSPEDFAQLEQRLRNLEITEAMPLYGGATPGITSHIPTGYGPFKGDAAIGAAYQNRNRGPSNDDGAIGGVIGFGSPRTVGVSLGLNIYDLGRLFDSRNTSFGDTASISLKLHRPVQRDTAVSVGVDDLIRRNPEPLQKPSYYAAVSRRVRLKPGYSEKFSRLYATVGVGNGRYRSINDIAADKSSIGIFGGLALMVHERATVFTEWTGQDLNLGVSFVPFRRYPLVITPALADLTHQGGSSTRFTLGAAYRLSY